MLRRTDDILDPSGSPSGAVLVGDANTMSDHARGGDDRLISGPGDDLMFGDAREPLTGDARGGHDTFVFPGMFGNDTVGDFRQGEDHLEFQVTGINDLQIVAGADSTEIIVADHGTVTLDHFTGTLRPGDFIFA
jgi:hypothetical protein